MGELERPVLGGSQVMGGSLASAASAAATGTTKVWPSVKCSICAMAVTQGRCTAQRRRSFSLGLRALWLPAPVPVLAVAVRTGIYCRQHDCPGDARQAGYWRRIRSEGCGVGRCRERLRVLSLERRLTSEQPPVRYMSGLLSCLRDRMRVQIFRRFCEH